MGCQFISLLLLTSGIAKVLLALPEMDTKNRSQVMQYFEHRIDNEPAFMDESTGHLRYLVFAPRVIRPDTILRVFVHVIHASHPVRIQASLRTVGGGEGSAPSDPLQESDAGMLFDRSVNLLGSPSTGKLLIPLPSHLPPARYSLLLLGDPPDRRGGSLFRHLCPLEYSERFLSILIQTNKLVYNVKQTIRIRVVLLDLRQLPWDQPIDIWLLDSRGIIMKRWISLYPFQGLVSVQFPLPGDYSKGWWKVRVQAGPQKEERSLLVERWFTHRFDLQVHLPSFVELDKRAIPLMISANYTNYLPVHANATIRVQIRPPIPDRPQEWAEPIHVYERFVPEFRGLMWLRLPLQHMLIKLFPHSADGALLNVEVLASELYQGTSVAAFCNTLLRNQSVTLRFLDRSPALFKPGMPFTTQLHASLSDHRALLPETLLTAQVELRTSFYVTGPEKVHSLQNTLPLQLDMTGLAPVRLHIPHNISSFELTARYFDGQVERFAKLQALAFQSPSGRHLQVETSNDQLTVGEYAVLHVRANFRLQQLYYIVTAKGVQLLHEQVDAASGRRSVSTFSVALSAEMVPACRILVYTVSTDSELIADSILLPVQSAIVRPVELYVNMQQDKLGEKPELVPNAGQESIVAMWALDQEGQAEIHAFAQLNQAHLQLQMDRLESPATRKRLLLRNEYGLPIKAKRLPITQANLDAGQAMQLADVWPMGNIPFHISPLCSNSVTQKLLQTSELPVLIKDEMGSQSPSDDGIRPLKWPQNENTNGYYFQLPTSGFSFIDDASRWSAGSWSNRYGNNFGNAYDPRISGYPYSGGYNGPLLSHFWPIDLLPHSKSNLEEMQAKDAALNAALAERKWRCATVDTCIEDRHWCDGRSDCPDGSDERDCDRIDWQSEQLIQYLAYRSSRTHSFYDVSGEDFAWQHTFTGYTDDNYVSVRLPTRPTHYQVYAYALHPVFGFRLLDTTNPVVISSERPFDMILETPNLVILGEQIGLQIAIFNNRPLQMIVEILLHGSADYRFVQVEENGYVSAYKARTRSGTQQHLILLHEYERRLVPMPIVATTSGRLNVHVSARCMLAHVHRRLTLEVLPEGVPVHLHTSLLLDLRAQGQLLKYLDINVTEEAEIPYQYERRFLYGSPAAYVHAIGDVVGTPVLQLDQSNLVDFADLSISHSADCGELFAFNFAYHVHSAHYLRLTGQLDREQQKRWMHVLNQDYVHISSFFDRECCFGQFGPHSTSVWLNAHIAATLASASYSEWDTQLHIDPKLLQAAVEFILRHQTRDGYFIEPTFNPLLYKTRQWKPIWPPPRPRWSFNQTYGFNNQTLAVKNKVAESTSDAIFRYFNQPTLGSTGDLNSYAQSNFFYQNHSLRIPTGEEKIRFGLMPLPEYMWPEQFVQLIPSPPIGSNYGLDFKPLPNNQDNTGAATATFQSKKASLSASTKSWSPSSSLPKVTLEPAFAEQTPEVTPGPPEPPGMAYAGIPLQAYPDTDHVEPVTDQKQNFPSNFYQTAFENLVTNSSGQLPLGHVDAGLNSDFAYRLTPVALTAHVLLSLSQVQGISGETAAKLEQSKRAAVRYLEPRLNELTSPFELAICTHALLAAGRVAEAQTGFERLHASHRHSEGMMYWSRTQLSPSPIRHETQRTYTLFRAPSRFDAESVEATAHALQVYTRLNALQQDHIVRFLNHMRLHPRGFIGSSDTVVALQALTEFTFRHHVRSVTRLHVQLEPSSEPGQRFYWMLGEPDLQVNDDQWLRPIPGLSPGMASGGNPDNILRSNFKTNADPSSKPSPDGNHFYSSTNDAAKSNQRLATERVARVFPNVWGHVTALVEGSGYGLLQLRTIYNVDREHLLLQPPVKAFDLDVRYLYSGRNQSSLDVEACARWLLTNESLFSDLAVLEIDLPTGYLQVRQLIDDYVDAGLIPNLKRARIAPRIAVFMFDHIYPNGTCIRFNVERWFPIANSTKWLQAKIYELNRPELFTTRIIENYVLYVMDICRVCGSYQCPYCPYYSHSKSLNLSTSMFIVCCLISLVYFVAYRSSQLNSLPSKKSLHPSAKSNPKLLLYNK